MRQDKTGSGLKMHQTNLFYNKKVGTYCPNILNDFMLKCDFLKWEEGVTLFVKFRKDPWEHNNLIAL